MFKVVLLMSPFAGYDRGLLHGIARYARLRGFWAFYLSGDHPGLPLPGIETLSGVPIRVHTHLGSGRRHLARSTESRPHRLHRQNPDPGHCQGGSCLRLARHCHGPLRAQLAGGSPLARLSEIRPDSHKAGRLAAEHLLERGFRHFAFCGYLGRIWSLTPRRGLLPAPERVGVFLSCLSAAAAEVALLLAAGAARPDRLAPVAAETAGGHGVQRRSRPSGHRGLAIGGMHVPSDIAVVGVDEDSLLSDLANPPLSSVARRRASRLSGRGVAARNDVGPSEPATPDPGRRALGRVAAFHQCDCRGGCGRGHGLALHSRQCAAPIGVQDVVKHLAVLRRTLEIRFQGTLGRSIRAEIRAGSSGLGQADAGRNQFAGGEDRRAHGLQQSELSEPSFPSRHGPDAGPLPPRPPHGLSPPASFAAAKARFAQNYTTNAQTFIAPPDPRCQTTGNSDSSTVSSGR